MQAGNAEDQHLAALAVDPDTIYTDNAVALALGLNLQILGAARREGRLRFTRQGRRVLILGRWLLEWLEAEAERQQRATYRTPDS
jgi:hypothetical protein